MKKVLYATLLILLVSITLNITRTMENYLFDVYGKDNII
jgi:hypothetical protein